jgi:hypothetical protein
MEDLISQETKDAMARFVRLYGPFVLGPARETFISDLMDLTHRMSQDAVKGFVDYSKKFD